MDTLDFKIKNFYSSKDPSKEMEKVSPKFGEDVSKTYQWRRTLSHNI
jgi:hypothetical protein